MDEVIITLPLGGDRHSVDTVLAAHVELDFRLEFKGKSGLLAELPLAAWHLGRPGLARGGPTEATKQLRNAAALLRRLTPAITQVSEDFHPEVLITTKADPPAMLNHLISADFVAAVGGAGLPLRLGFRVNQRT